MNLVLSRNSGKLVKKQSNETFGPIDAVSKNISIFIGPITWSFLNPGAEILFNYVDNFSPGFIGKFFTKKMAAKNLIRNCNGFSSLKSLCDFCSFLKQRITFLICRL